MSRNELVEILIELIGDGRLFSSTMLPGNVDAALDARDSPAVESAWLTCYRRLGEHKPLPETEQRLLDLVGAITFKIGEQLLNGPHEFTEQVADDLQLIARSLLLGGSDSYANALLAVYLRGEFPIHVAAFETPTASAQLRALK